MLVVHVKYVCSTCINILTVKKMAEIGPVEVKIQTFENGRDVLIHLTGKF